MQQRRPRDPAFARIPRAVASNSSSVRKALLLLICKQLIEGRVGELDAKSGPALPGSLLGCGLRGRKGSEPREVAPLVRSVAALIAWRTEGANLVSTVSCFVTVCLSVLVYRAKRPLRGSVSCGSGWSVPRVSIQLTLSQYFQIISR